MSVRRRRGEDAQSLVETALVLPFLIMLALGFAGAILIMDATTELRAATSVATSSAFGAPYGATQQALYDITDSFQRSAHGSFFVPGSLRITCPASEGNQYLYATAYQPDTQVSCHGRATLSFSHSVIGLVWQWPIPLEQDAQVAVPPFRQCAAAVTC